MVEEEEAAPPQTKKWTRVHAPSNGGVGNLCHVNAYTPRLAGVDRESKVVTCKLCTAAVSHIPQFYNLLRTRGIVFQVEVLALRARGASPIRSSIEVQNDTDSVSVSR